MKKEHIKEICKSTIFAYHFLNGYLTQEMIDEKANTDVMFARYCERKGIPTSARYLEIKK